ncbi:type II toxin-antitoxin system HicA family toxin [Desulfobacterota bacterium AH_259_B03_O07]|nr:type II toxin-antitoxin system HicA family toxin [Desulfobacterota bacterium AH_259_B03_O07]
MKLPVLSGIEVIKRLKKLGFIATRQKGSHVRLEKYSEGKIIKLTVPLHAELKRGTLRRIIKDASLTLKKFLELK